MRSIFLAGGIAIFALALGGAAYWYAVRTPSSVTSVTPPPSQPPTASSTPPAASSTPPQPVPREKGTVTGAVLLGPVCPVERIPPDPQCAPRPYATTIRIQATGNPSSSFMLVPTNASGTFSVLLDPGDYTLSAESQNGSFYPRCEDVGVAVLAGRSQAVVISCDTGIR